MQKKIQPRRFLELFRCIERRFQRFPGDNWTVIRQQYGAVLCSEATHRFRQRPVARGIVGYQGQRADAHDIVGRQRWQNIPWVDIGQAGDGYRVRRMQVHDGAGTRALLINRVMQKALLGRRISGNMSAVMVQLRDCRRIQSAETRVCRRQQPTVVDTHADVAGTAHGKPTIEEGLSEQRNLLA